MGNSIPRALACGVSLAVLALLAPLACAFPCERMGASSDCRDVWSSGLPDEEKTAVVAGLVDDVGTWNTAFDVREPPAGTSVYSDDLVRGAWVRIMSVMPSVYENSTLLSPGYGEVTEKSWYTTVTPSGTQAGDCQTDYSLAHSSRIESFLNGVFLGSDAISSFSTAASVLDFQANLIINIDLSVDHYQWYRTSRHSHTCRFAWSEVRRKSITLTDTKQVVRHQPSMPYTFKVQNRYYGIDQVAFDASGYSWFRIQFNPESYYEERLDAFNAFFHFEPYYILNYEVKPNNTATFRNVQGSKHTFQVSNLSGCTITLGDYFRNYTYLCPTDYTPLNLKIQTDKDVYSESEQINIAIEPIIPVKVSYGNESRSITGTTSFLAKSGVGLIIAKAEGVEAFKSIQIKGPTEQNTWGVLAGFGLFFYLWSVYSWRVFGVKV